MGSPQLHALQGVAEGRLARYAALHAAAEEVLHAAHHHPRVVQRLNLHVAGSGSGLPPMRAAQEYRAE